MSGRAAKSSFSTLLADNRTYCEYLFKYATKTQLCHKYAYYVLSVQYVTDVAYDLAEKDWYFMGRALGVLDIDDISPCIDFDYKHKWAAEAIALSNTLKPRPLD